MILPGFAYEREPGSDLVETGDLRIDFDQQLVFKHGQPVDLTPTEFHILANLAREMGQVVRGPALLNPSEGQRKIGTWLATPALSFIVFSGTPASR